MDSFLGGLLSAGSSLIGGLFGSNNQSKALEAQEQMASDNYQHQKEFAQQGLQWRANDATAAQTASGINRLALLGAPTASFSNNIVSPDASNPMGAGIAAAGQDIQRAISAYADRNDRQTELKNKLLEAQIANTNSDTVKNQAAASKIATQAPTTPGLPPLYMKYSDGRGGVVTLPTKDASSSMQNWASLPAQLGVAAGEVGHSIEDAWSAFRSSMGQIPFRGDAWRGVDNSYYVPF